MKAEKRRCPWPDSCLLHLKLFNLFFWGGTAFVLPYCVNILHALGLTTREVAVIVGAVPLVGMVTGPGVGMLADKFAAHRRLLVACLGAWIAGFQGLAAIPSRRLTVNTTYIGSNNTNVTMEMLEYLATNDFHPDLTFWLALLCYFVIEVND